MQTRNIDQYKETVLFNRNGLLASINSATIVRLGPVVCIPAGLVHAGDKISVSIHGSFVSSAHTRAVYMRLGNNSAGDSNSIIAAASTGADTNVNWYIDLMLSIASLTSQNYMYSVLETSGFASCIFGAWTTDFNSNVYISLAGYDVNPNEIDLLSFMIKHIKGSV